MGVILVATWALPLYIDEKRQAKIIKNAEKVDPDWRSIKVNKYEYTLLKRPLKLTLNGDVWEYNNGQQMDSLELYGKQRITKNTTPAFIFDKYWADLIVLLSCFDKNEVCIIWRDGSIDNRTIISKTPILGGIINFIYQVGALPNTWVYKNNYYFFSWSSKSGLMNIKNPCSERYIKDIKLYENKLLVICNSQDMFLTDYFDIK